MRHLRPSLLLLMAFSLLIFSCDPDKAEKKQSETNQDGNNDDPNNPPNPPNPQTPEPPEQPAIPVASLGEISTTASEDARTEADTSGKSLGWVFQEKEITFSTKAKDAEGNPIANAQFKWQWRKRGKGKTTPKKFGHTWTTIDGQTTANAKLDILAAQRVGAYELRVSATSGGKTVDNHKETPYKFTVRKSGCLPPSTTNRPANLAALKVMVTGPSALPDKDIPTIDTSLVENMEELFSKAILMVRLTVGTFPM